MKHKIKVAIKKRIQIISHALITLACITAVVYFMPRDKIFNYRYSINTPWSYGQIIAKFNFPVYKSNEQLKAEKDSIISAFEPYFTKDAEVAESALQEFRRKYNNEYYNYISEEQYVAYNFELRELYNQYHKQGLEIYSVGIERNLLAWEEATENLPWLTVRALDNEITEVLTRYNVQSIPTLFLFDKEGNVQGRYTDFTALEADINKYL